MPRTLVASQCLALITAYYRFTSLESRNETPPPPPVIQSHNDFPNEGVDHDQVLDLDALLDRQTFQATWPFSINCPAATFVQLGNFIHNCGLYDSHNRRWKDIVDGIQFDVLVGLFRHIIDALHNSYYNHSGGVICTTARFFPSAGGPPFKTMPSFAVCGTRWMFPPNNEHGIDSGFLFHAGPIEIAFEKDILESHERLQLAIYARQYLLEQPSRHTVKCLLLTETNVRLYSFDSNGLLYFDAVNIHERPIEFLWTIVQLSNEGSSLDHDHDTIWKDGLLFMQNKNLYADPLEIIDGVPSYASENFMGRRTVCWKVRADDGSVGLLKNSSAYLDEKRNTFLEWQFLELAQGIPGVCRMYGHVENLTTNVFGSSWCSQYPEYPLQYTRRCYLALEYYGRSVLDFNDRTELLWILHDAITTHKTLWMRGIWHDDIRPENIRIGNPGSENSSRAVLIGFARAKKVDPLADYHSGFQWDDARRDKNRFKSGFRPMRLAAWYGYLHDIESFLLILCSICSIYHAPHTPTLPDQSVRQNLAGWDSSDFNVSFKLKETFLQQVGSPGRVKPFFGQIFVDLIRAWTIWLDAAFLELPWAQKLPQINAHYDDVLQMIDSAIWRIQDEAEPHIPCGSNIPITVNALTHLHDDL